MPKPKRRGHAANLLRRVARLIECKLDAPVISARIGDAADIARDRLIEKFAQNHHSNKRTDH